MATIINTLEVIIEPPTPAAADAPQAAPASAPLTPHDLADVAERRARLAARLAAH
jgi:hypothetical protein